MVSMAGITTRMPPLAREQRLWLRYLIADLEGDSERMRRAGQVLDALRRRAV
jgi:hypothetical protein